MSQKRLARKHAQSIVPAAPGLPLIRSTPNLELRLVRLKGTIDVEEGLASETTKKAVYHGFKRFVEWMGKEGHEYKGGLEITGPFPHMDYKGPDTQVGDRGATRPVARQVEQDLGNNGKLDYVIEGNFLVRETIQEVPTSVARDVIGKRGIRAMRDIQEGATRDG